MQIGRIRPGTRRLGVHPPVLGHAVPPCRGSRWGSGALPQIGTGVWIEFEQGDPDLPIWSGCWYGIAAEVPVLALAAPPAVPNIVLQTTAQNTLMLSDMPGPTGGILLKTTTGALISVNDLGITISNGKGAIITMTGPTVAINLAALVVT